jgi:hypothetical protein
MNADFESQTFFEKKILNASLSGHFVLIDIQRREITIALATYGGKNMEL